MNPQLKTIFFASTWGGTNGVYNDEKVQIVQHLLQICEANNYQLIIKKHPAETDNKLDELMKKHQYHSFKIFNHGELNLYQALAATDVLITQNSSISAEALYYHKPVMFVNLTDQLIWPDLLPFIHEKFAFNVRSLTDLEKNIIFIFDNLDTIANEVKQHADKYIYKPDGNASQRLLDLCLKLKEERGA
jgi:CDP-glycerol glycerophosphotransferase (TagB/SpsB family)